MIKSVFRLVFFIVIFGIHAVKAATFDHQFQNLIHQSLPNVAIGLVVQNAQTGKVLYSNRAFEGFTPASTTKLFTAVAALEYLKPDYQFETRLDFDKNQVENGVLYGNLYLTFTGDPTFTSLDLKQLFTRLRASGIHKLNNNIVVDHSRFESTLYAPGWSVDDVQWHYGAPISAIIIDRNKAAKNAVDNPKELAKKRIRESLLKERIGLKGEIIFTNTPKQLTGKNTRSIIHYSENLEKIIKHTLVHSNNIAAESLIKTLGYYYYDKGSFKDGVLATQAILSPITGIDFSKMRLHDGSGLSHYNCLTPSHLARLLFSVYNHDKLSDVFIDALPISGQTGTLKLRLQAKGHQGQVFAKTGTLNGKSALAGFIKHKKNKNALIMVIMINQSIAAPADIKRCEDKIVNLILNHPEFA